MYLTRVLVCVSSDMIVWGLYKLVKHHDDGKKKQDEKKKKQKMKKKVLEGEGETRERKRKRERNEGGKEKEKDKEKEKEKEKEIFLRECCNHAEGTDRGITMRVNANVLSNIMESSSVTGVVGAGAAKQRSCALKRHACHRRERAARSVSVSSSTSVSSPMTMTEKIMARASGKKHVSAGENTWVNTDILMVCQLLSRECHSFVAVQGVVNVL